MKARLTVNTSQAAELVEHIIERGTRSQRARMMKEMGAHTAQALSDRLLEGRFKPLKPLQPITLEIHGRGGHKHPLVRSGRLARSIRVLHSGPRKTTIGSRLPYAGRLEEDFGFLQTDGEITSDLVDLVIDFHLGA